MQVQSAVLLLQQVRSMCDGVVRLTHARRHERLQLEKSLGVSDGDQPEGLKRESIARQVIRSLSTLLICHPTRPSLTTPAGHRARW